LGGLAAPPRQAAGASLRPGTVFFKLTGSGNDFVALDGGSVRASDVTPLLVAALCDRRHGVGADGLMLLEPQGGDPVHFIFRFWNSDGSEGPMCGNGALCATRLAATIGMAPSDGEIRIGTAAGVHRGWLVGQNQSEIELPDCDLPEPRPAVATLAGELAPMVGVPSVPHLVLEVADLDGVDVMRRGPLLRHDPALGLWGANVNWIGRVADGGWRMRTYERGVEGETLACGTGAVACALSLGVKGTAKPPVRIWTKSGLPLDVSWESRDGRATSIRLTGEGRLVFRGVLSSLPTISS
jgi:diaminopimelate epimerase